MDAERNFQQRALRNVRALLDRVERNDEAQRKRQWRLALFAMLPLVLLLGGVAMMRLDATDAEQEHARCEHHSFKARNGEIERRLREANPQITYREIREQLKREYPFVQAGVEIDCGPMLK